MQEVKSGNDGYGSENFTWKQTFVEKACYKKTGRNAVGASIGKSV